MRYWPVYVSVASRKAEAAKKIEKLKKSGKDICPVVISGRTIARTFWGKSWCKHLESYSDYENRLPRGRSYVRNNLVIDLKINKGVINALVSGSSVYTVNIEIKALDTQKWQGLIKECAGKIDSLIELLQGKFSKAIMEIIINKDQGLFPHPNEIKLKCSCPDSASMCKHVAAVLYGVGARFDEESDKLFLLRHVDHLDLISAATSSKELTSKSSKDNKTLDDSDLSSLFDIEFDTTTKASSSKQATIKATAKVATVIKKPAKKTINPTKTKPTKEKSAKIKSVKTTKKTETSSKAQPKKIKAKK